jgi:hypothetical protein
VSHAVCDEWQSIASSAENMDATQEDMAQMGSDTGDSLTDAAGSRHQPTLPMFRAPQRVASHADVAAAEQQRSQEGQHPDTPQSASPNNEMNAASTLLKAQGFDITVQLV